MGFGFNLFGFPILLLVSVGLLIYFLTTQRRVALAILCGLWGATIAVSVLSAIIDQYRRPMLLTKHDILGEYRIDTTFYTGAKARWQYHRYKFYLTKEDSIRFVIIRANEAPQMVITHKVHYSEGTPVTWSIVADSTHHVIRGNPTLYRGHDRFYYVFNSKHYGNMFFRKLH